MEDQLSLPGIRIHVEPILEAQIQGQTPEAVLRRAKTYYRWHCQIRVFLRILSVRGDCVAVKLEPELHLQILGKDPLAIVELGRIYRRWSKQLYLLLTVHAPGVLPSRPSPRAAHPLPPLEYRPVLPAESKEESRLPRCDGLRGSPNGELPDWPHPRSW